MVDRTRPRPEVCVGAVVRDGSQLLLIQRGRPPEMGRWSLPGGRVEAGETLAQAVVREVGEETGLPVVCGPLIGWVERFGDDFHYVILDFEATALESEPLVAGDDAADVAWIEIDDLDQLHLAEGVQEFLSDHGISRTIA